MTIDNFPRDYNQLPPGEMALLKALANVFFEGDIDRAWDKVLDNHDNNPSIKTSPSVHRKAVVQLRISPH